MDKFAEYFKGIKAEWGKITWPERKQVIVQTIIVLCIVILFTMYTYVLDIIFQVMVNGTANFINIFLK